MKQLLMESLAALLSDADGVNNVYFAVPQQETNLLACQMECPRLEFLLAGSQKMQWGVGVNNKIEQVLLPGNAVFLPVGCWNIPYWDEPATTLSILFGKDSVGFGLFRWDGKEKHSLAEWNIEWHLSRIDIFIFQIIQQLPGNQNERLTVQFLIKGLLSHLIYMLSAEKKTMTRSAALFLQIRNYIDDNYSKPLTRDSVSAVFHISANHLSHFFNKEGNVGFKKYLNFVRLEKAKELLRQERIKVKEIAYACGFVDSNYFCRLFQKEMGCSPLEYRQQYYDL